MRPDTAAAAAAAAAATFEDADVSCPAVCLLIYCHTPDD